ncbi:universal stress protein [Alkalihalobacterium elongatum]|uniref:universal stress protein n=1 Tax=Alkalihalobacterium elongatum TaxID=2675466 RepID=UPI001C1F4D5C|nr:universal stress protein [Alkalihalobacterium elongatum]
MEKNYRNVLVAVDGSEEANVALNKAFDIVKKDNAQLFIAHVIDTRTFATVEQYDRTVVSRAEGYAKELLNEYKVKAEEAGVTNATTVLDFGSPKVRIAKDIAQKHEIDLIVTGATGLNAVERILIGSVSEAITRNAKCDVLIVRK